MNQPAHKTEGVNCPNPKRFHRFTFTGNAPRKGWRIPLDEIKYNEQRDEEKEMSGGHFASERGEEPRSGMQYCSSLSFTNFGTRYMDHELMTMWLSVDPMADKYPGISPYAYCAWNRPTGGHEHLEIKIMAANNPVKLVDPDGRELDEPQRWAVGFVRNAAFNTLTNLVYNMNRYEEIVRLGMN